MSTFYDGTIKLLTFVRPGPLHPSQDSKNSILIIFLFVRSLTALSRSRDNLLPVYFRMRLARWRFKHSGILLLSFEKRAKLLV